MQTSRNQHFCGAREQKTVCKLTSDLKHRYDPTSDDASCNIKHKQTQWRGPFNKVFHFIHVPGDRRHPYLHGCCGRCHGDRHSQHLFASLACPLLCIHHNKRYRTSSHVVEMIFVREETKKERERERVCFLVPASHHRQMMKRNTSRINQAQGIPLQTVSPSSS